ncbi:MAG TPA: NAD-dependent dehydratase [Pseudoduganella sp.]
MRLLLVGSSGLVGREVLKLALASPAVGRVTALTRKPLGEHRKLQTEVVDFDRLPEGAPWWKADAVLCTLGTTIKAAGSKEAFRRVDYDYPLEVGRRARLAGTPTYVLNSAFGADPFSHIFYNRTKGELERDLATLGYPSLTLVRPGLIGGEREEFRLAERIWLPVLGALAPVLPKAWRISPAPVIARAMMESAIYPAHGVNVISSDQLSGT